MTYLTVEESVKFRKGNEGVFDGDVCIHFCTPPEQIDTLMNSLFSWMKKNKDNIHPLILSFVFHYEFVFIHPFSDGNGRTVRLWQNLILSKWENIFEYVPIESQIKKYQDEYYSSINDCNKKGDSTEFVEFMLRMIDETLLDLLKQVEVQSNHISIYVNKLLEVMEPGVAMTTHELMQKLDLKSRASFKENYLDPALDSGLIKMTEPNKPTSKNQRYYKV